MSVHEAKAHFSALIRHVESGEAVVVTRNDRPVAEIRSYKERRAPQLGAFAEPGTPHLEVSWTEEELDDLFGDLLKPVSD